MNDERVIEPARGWAPLRARELWRSRELVYFLAWRDIKVRYRQTVLGIAWAVLQPVLMMLVFTGIFSRLARVPSEGVPYPLFAFTALVPWTLFSTALAQSSASVVASQNLIRKVYFPRLAIPVSTMLSALVDFGLALLVLLALAAWYGVPLTPRVLWLPPLILLALAAALGIGLWLSALNVLYRDVQYVIPFLTQLWLFATPIAYPSSLLDPRWRDVLALNPLAGVVEGFRWALLGTGRAPGGMIAISTAATLCILVGGVLYFLRMERTFADVV
jgi:lipopolysaccharide transport system permease protein